MYKKPNNEQTGVYCFKSFIINRHTAALMLILGVLPLSTMLAQNQPRLVLPTGHMGALSSGMFSPDGKMALTASEDRLAKLWDVGSGRLLRDFVHQEGVLSATFSPDGTLIATGSDEDMVRLWNVSTGKLIWEQPGHKRRVNTVVFSPDGKKVLSASADRTAKVWDVKSGKMLSSLVGHRASVNTALFSPDGKKIVTAADDGDFSGGGAIIWDAQAGIALVRLTGHTFFVNSAVFSGDGKKVVTASSDQTAKVWNAGSGAVLADLTGHTDKVYSAAFSPDGEWIVTASADKTARIWASVGGRLLAVLPHGNQVRSARFSPDGRSVLTASADGSARIWKVSGAVPVAELSGHTDAVTAAEYSPNGRNIITISEDRTATIWDAATARPTARLKGYAAYLKNADFSPDGRSIVTAAEMTARVLDVATGTPVATLKGHKGWVRSARFSPDGQWIVTASDEGKASVWNAISGALQFDLEGHTGPVLDAAYSPTGNQILTIDGSVRLWKADSGTLLHQLEGHTGAVEYATYSQDGNWVLTASRDGTAKVWAAPTGRMVSDLVEQKTKDKAVTGEADKQYDPAVWGDETAKMLRAIDSMAQQLGDWIWSGALSPDARQAVTVSVSGTTKIWDVQTGRVKQTLKGHSGSVYAAKFSPNGSRLVTVSDDRTAIIWDVVTGKELHRLKGHNLGVMAAYFSPDGKRIYTTSYDQVVNTWDAANGKLLASYESNGVLADIDFKTNQLIVLGSASIDVHNLNTGALNYTWMAVNESDWLVLLPDSRHFMCARDAARRLHYATSDLKTVGFEQLDIQFNRPDMVLSRLAGMYGHADTVRIQAYNKAWQKRVRSMGVDTAAFTGKFSVPVCDLQNRDSIGPVRDNPQILLRISGSDPTFPIDRWNIWVNEVPVFGSAGIRIGYKGQSVLDTVVSITLSAGQNIIEASVTNTQGIESYRTPIFIQYQKPDQMPEKTFFIGVGVDKYQESKHNLRYSVKDIRDLVAIVRLTLGANVIVDTLFDEQVTRENFMSLKNKLLKTTEDDKVIISFSGHGILGSDFDYYLATHDIQFDDPSGRGLPYEEVEQLLDGIRARKRLLLLDACHSGEVDKEALLAINTTSKPAGVKGLVLPESPKPKLGMDNSVELMKELFANVQRGTGAYVVSAAGGTQFAYEQDKLKNGVFTFSFIELMRLEKQMAVRDLKSRVEERVMQLTNGLQRPTSRRDLNRYDWRVW